LDSAIDPRFGRCAYFLLVETDDLSFEAVDNQNNALGGGAGIQTARSIASRGAKAVLTGNCGPNAYRTLEAAGIDVVVGCSGSVADAVTKLKDGQLRAASSPNVSLDAGIDGMRR